jgi:hypothetical protein
MEQLRRNADEAAVDLSTLARAQITGAPIPRRKRRVSVDTSILARVLVQLGRIGGNVNQIARVANTTGELKSELEIIRAAVREALTP